MLSNLKRRRIFFSSVFVTFAIFASGLLFGFPWWKSTELSEVGSVVSGEYNPREMILTPVKHITDKQKITTLIKVYDHSQAMLVLPTLGRLRGPYVLLDEDDEPICASFYQYEHNGMVFYHVASKNSAYKIGKRFATFGGVFQEVVKCDFSSIINSK